MVEGIDRVCRYGGEEIMAILPETDIAEATTVAERQRATIASHPFEINTATPLNITVSTDAASWPMHADNAEALVAAADSALYKAKNTGRNQVVRYTQRV